MIVDSDRQPLCLLSHFGIKAVNFPFIVLFLLFSEFYHKSMVNIELYEPNLKMKKKPWLETLIQTVLCLILLILFVLLIYFCGEIFSVKPIENTNSSTELQNEKPVTEVVTETILTS